MSISIKVLMGILVVLLVQMGFMPQKAAAHSMDERLAQQKEALAASMTAGGEAPVLSEWAKGSLALAAGFINPAMGSALADANGGDLASRRSAYSGALGASTQPYSPAQGNSTATQRTLGIDPDGLIAATPEPPAEGLLLVTRKNSWSTAPANHEELVRCVEEESFREVGWSGAGIVSQIDQNENIYGNDNSFTSYYEAFFRVRKGTWSFAIDSAGPSEIEIDGQVVASWYGAHDPSGDWSHSGSISLDVGWHHLICRYVAGTESQTARVAYKESLDTEWRILGTSELLLKPVNLEEGLLLVTRKNNCSTAPKNHGNLMKCVQKDSTRESGWYGASIVLEIYQEENIHGNDDNYTSYYETFFYVDTGGIWWFATDSDGPSEIQIDRWVVASWYESHGASGDWSHNGSISLDIGWHRLIYRYQAGTGTHAAWAAFKRPRDNKWRPLHISMLTLKGVCYMGVDGDRLPDSVEAVLGTDPETSDTDLDMLDDYYEAKNGLDPLEPDSNNDGLPDYYEVTDVLLDIDGDGTPNAWDPDNDDDGVTDGLDTSPFAKTVSSDKFHFQISTGGDPTYIDFQVRPEDPDHLNLPLQTWDWPYDEWGTMQDTDGSEDDVRIVPMLELAMNQFPDQSQLDDYGVVISNSRGDGITPNWSPVINEAGFATPFYPGGGTAIADINGNGKRDLVLMGFGSQNVFCYKVGWDLKPDGTASSWSPIIKEASGIGVLIGGGGAAIADINGNGKPDLVLMGIDLPLSGNSSFWYKVGWDLKSDGTASSWSPIIKETGLGPRAAGGGTAIADINGNGSPDLVLMGIDTLKDFSSNNSFWYKVGWDLNSDGTASSWSPIIKEAGLGNDNSGGGADIADINGNGKLDLVLMGVNKGSDSSSFWYKVGWDLEEDGIASSWSPVIKQARLDLNSDGGGTAVADIDGSGKLDLVLMTMTSRQRSKVSFSYAMGWDLRSDETRAYVPLLPNQDNGNTVAFTGRMFYPGGSQLELEGDARFVWMVEGKSDYPGAQYWSPIGKQRGLSPQTTGGGTAIADINGNGRPDLVLMGINNPAGADVFWYKVGWDLDVNGSASSWSPIIKDADLGNWDARCGDAAIGDINGNGKPDLVLMAIAGSENSFVYRVGWDLKADGTASSWSPIKMGGAGLGGTPATGGGVAITDINGNGKLDLFLLGITVTTQGSLLWYRWVYDLDSDGTFSSWSRIKMGGGEKYSSSGGGADIADLNGNGKPDLLLTGIEDASGHNWFWYKVCWDIDYSTELATFSSWSPVIRHEVAGKSCAGGGAAIADINDNGRLDLVLMAIDNPNTGDDYFQYTIGFDIETAYTTLAKYRDNFMLTGFTVEEDQGCDAGLFYEADLDQTTRAYLALRYLFLDSQDTLDQAAARLPQYNIAVTSDIRHFAHGDEALKQLTTSMVIDALQSLPAGKVLPIAFATATTSRTVGMDSSVTSSCTLGDTFDIDLSDAPQITMKAIKLPWYNTATAELLEDEAIMDEVASWGWSADEEANVAMLLLVWSEGETNMTKLDIWEVPPVYPKGDEVLSDISQTPQILKFLGKLRLAYRITPLVLLAVAYPLSIVEAVRASRVSYETFKARSMMPYFRHRVMTHIQRLINWNNPLLRALHGSGSGAINPEARLRLIRGGYVKYGNYLKFLKGVGRVLIVTAVAFILAEFIMIAASEGWSKYGFMVGGVYAVMDLVYLAILIALAYIPVVGWIIDILIILADVIASIFGYGSGWLIQKLVGALAKFKLRTEVDLITIGTSSGVVDYDDNGITVGDLIESRSGIIGQATKTDRGTNNDVHTSYIAPKLKATVRSEGNGANAIRIESWSNKVSTTESSYLKRDFYDLGLRVESSVPVIGAPLAFVRLDANYDISYDQCILGVCSPKRYADVVNGNEEGLSFDILPNSIDDFIGWSAISEQDSDLDTLADSVEGTADLENDAYYRLVNKSSGRCLAAEESLGPNVRVLDYAGDNGQKWKIGCDLDSAVYLTAFNGNYVSADLADYPGELVVVSDTRSPTERFEIVLLGGDKIALRAWNGKYVSAEGGALDTLLAVADEIGEKEKFEMVAAGDNLIALRAWNGKYVSAEGEYLDIVAVADEIAETGEFAVEWHGGYYTLSTYIRNWEYLTVEGKGLAEEAIAVRVPDPGADYQEWAMQPVGQGYYKIIARRSGKCLTASSSLLGASVVQKTYNGSDEQKWRLEPVESSTDKYNRDTDADDLGDGFELASVVDLVTSPCNADTDGDGLNDKLELELGTSPTLKDTDSDGLSDYEEHRGWQLAFAYYGISVSGMAYPDPLTVDGDGDGLSDYEEYQKRLNPRSSDTNGDGIPDGAGETKIISLRVPEADQDSDGLLDSIEEAGWNITVTDEVSGTQTANVTSDPLLTDTDSDGVSDSEESDLHSNPRDGDTDGDGLGDSAESELGTNIAYYDSDGDGLSDSNEITNGSDPLKADTDKDGVSDLLELEFRSDPTSPDTDGDGLTDLEELAGFTSANKADTDDDSLLDSQEEALGTNPNASDSDQDNSSDGYEVSVGTDPLNDDSDGDGLQDGEEQRIGTDPLKPDSDADGLTDSQEVEQYGSDPLNADSDNDGTNDAADPDTTTPFLEEICILYDGSPGSYSGFIGGLSQYANVTHGTLESIPDYQDRPYLILLGYPSAEEGTVGSITYNLLSEEIRNRMLESDYHRLARGVNTWPNNKLVIMLSRSYRNDHLRVLAMIKNLEVQM